MIISNYDCVRICHHEQESIEYMNIMNDAFIVTTTVTIVLAFGGYMATYFNSVRLAQRNQRLERINKQLGDFYGPMYGLINSETAVFNVFRSIYRPGKHFFDEEDPPTEEDLVAWRLWMTTVFAIRSPNRCDRGVQNIARRPMKYDPGNMSAGRSRLRPMAAPKVMGKPLAIRTRIPTAFFPSVCPFQSPSSRMK